MNFRYICLSLACCFLTISCAKTTVVLVPDHDGKVGEVTVSNFMGEKKLDQSEQSVATSSYLLPSGSSQILDKEQVQATFQSTLSSEPEVPTHYMLYFKNDSVELKVESSGDLKDAIAFAIKRDTCDIILIGHTDTKGDSTYNVNLSLKRAIMIEQMLLDRGVESKCIKKRSYGEYDPIVKSGDNKSEPKNRRVEFIVR